MNSLFGARLFRPWIKVRIAKPQSLGLHDKPPKDPPAPGEDEADENSTKQAKTRPRAARRTKSKKRLPPQPEIGEKLPASNPKAWSPERRAAQSERAKRAWAQPGHKEKFAATRKAWFPERRAMISEKAKRIWIQPELREKHHSAALRVAF